MNTLGIRWFHLNIFVFSHILFIENQCILNRLKEVLDEKGIPYYLLAIVMNKAEGTITSWCNNIHQPSAADFRRIADFLNINQQDLIIDLPPDENKDLELMSAAHKQYMERYGSPYSGTKFKQDFIDFINAAIGRK